MVFTGHEFAEGGNFIAQTLKQQKAKASFFFTGDFYRNKQFAPVIKLLKQQGNYLGAHSDKHLLYCDWSKRDSLLVTKQQFSFDLGDNYAAMAVHKITGHHSPYFLPPYEWYNDSIAAWTKKLNLQLINYTPGTLSHADYTGEKDKNFRSSEAIYQSIVKYEKTKPSGLNGFILLMHIGAGSGRADKFYSQLPQLINYLKTKGYKFKRIDELLTE